MKKTVFTSSLSVLMLLTLCVFQTNALGLPAVINGPVTNPANNHDYYMLEISSWTDAEASAVNLGGHLATINDQAENDWVWNTFYPGHNPAADPHLWIGLNDVAVEGVFGWVSGEPVTFLNWDITQPDNAAGVEDYVGMWQVPPPDASGIAGKWNDFDNFIPTGTRVGYGVVEVPEPASLSLLVLGGLALVRKRRRN